MAEFFFYTEPSKLELQADIPSTTPGGPPDPAKAFGGIDANSFRLQNLFTATSSPKAIAVCDGTILVQAVDNPGGAITHVNIVLKPSSQPKLDLPKITYFIYKGVKISSLKSGSNLVSLGTNDLADKVWETHNTHKLKNPLLGANPDADAYLGLVYSASSSNAYYQRANDAFLDEIFYSSSQALLSIKGGDTIGEFDENGFGLMTITEKMDFSPKLELARTLDSILDVSSLGNENEHDENKFKFKLKREEVLAFMDDAVLWGGFHRLSRGLEVEFDETPTENDNVSIFGNPTTPTDLTNYLWQNILSKYKNHDCIYLDIRSEYVSAYNFYENYENYIQLIAGTLPISPTPGVGSSIQVPFENSSWPLFILKGSLFTTNVTYSDFKVQLTTSEVNAPIAYIAFGGALKQTDEPQRLIMGSTQEVTLVDLNYRWDLSQCYHSTNWIPSYIKLVILDQIRDLEVNTSPVKESFLDHIFPFSGINIPFETSPGYDSVDIVFYNDMFLVQNKTIDNDLIDECFMTSRIGLARDEGVFTFFVLPQKIKLAGWKGDDKYLPIQMATQRTRTSKNFFDLLINRIKSSNLLETKDLGGISYYSFAEGSNPKNTDLKNALSKGHYDFKNIHMLVISQEEMGNITTELNNAYPNRVKAYFGFKFEKFLVDGGTEAKVNLVVRGLHVKADHSIEPFEKSTNIVMVAEGNMFNNLKE